jgi:stearoyl-CoA desaturase (delta-9 desaturase)
MAMGGLTRGAVQATAMGAHAARPTTQFLRAAKLERRVAALTVLVPTAGVALASGLAAQHGWPPRSVFVVAALLYVLTALGITVGFHRMFTHRSFAAPAAVRAIFGILGSMAAQGPLLYWVAAHRRHHQHSDESDDPHSPHTQSIWRGLWHAHVGWMFAHDPEAWDRYARDVLRDRTAFWVSRHYVAWLVLSLALPALIVGLWERSLGAAALGALWGGLVRIFVVHHVTWSVNSICHVIGNRPFATGDRSTNNVLVALWSLGEGWHNNHHAFPRSAQHGLESWQCDPSYWCIRGLAWCRLARDVYLPSPAAKAAKRNAAGRRS